MSNIEILFTKFNQRLPGYLFNQYLTHLPTSLQEKNLRFHRWQDRQSHLFGKLLLLDGLNNYGFTVGILDEINYNQYSRPSIDGDIDFNITHSGEYVLCAIGKGLRLGIDVEEIREINFGDFRQVMTTGQWQDIVESTDATRSFFKYWTIKESVIKADSRGLSIPLLDIHVKDNKVIYDNQTWYLNELNLDKRYSAFLASDKKSVEYKLQFIDFYKFGEWNMEHGERNQKSEDRRQKIKPQLSQLSQLTD